MYACRVNSRKYRLEGRVQAALERRRASSVAEWGYRARDRSVEARRVVLVRSAIRACVLIGASS